REIAHFAPEEEAPETEPVEAIEAQEEPLAPKEAESTVDTSWSESPPIAPEPEAVAEPSVSSSDEASPEKSPEVVEAAENPETPDEEKPSEEENEPFADILENKDKKRYSPNPLPQQSSENSQ